MATIMWTGLVLGSVYSLVALGFDVALIPTGIINFAQGAIVIGGSFLAFEWLQHVGLPLAVCILINAVIGAAAGAVCELLGVRPLRRGGGETAGTRAIVTTVGLSAMLVGLFGVGWGSNPLAVPFRGPSGFVHLFGTPASPLQILTVCLAVVGAVGLELTFRLTRVGQTCLAVAEDREAAMLRGVNVNLLSIGGFAVAGMAGAVIGIFTGPITYAEASLGVTLALGGFVALALGGQGSFVGGLIGGWLVGLVSTLFVRYFGGNYDQIGVLVVLVVTLVALPNGIAGARGTRRAV